MKDTSYFWLRNLTKVIFLIMWQTKHLVKKTIGSSWWTRFNLQECCKSKDWGKTTVLQACNEEAFVWILHVLKWWCTHFLNVTIPFGLNSSNQIQFLGHADKFNQFEQIVSLQEGRPWTKKNSWQASCNWKGMIKVMSWWIMYSQQTRD
jgi:hypothetical protein